MPILKLDNDDFAIQLYEFLIFFWYWPLIRVHLQCRGPQFNSWVGKICCRGERLHTPVFWGFPSGSAGKESVCNAGDLGLILGLGRSPGEGKGYLLQYSGLENSMDCVVHGVAKSQTRLRDFHFHFFSHAACKYFLSFSRLPFHFVDFFFPSFCTEAVWCNSTYSLLLRCFCSHIQNIISKTNVKELYPFVFF